MKKNKFLTTGLAIAIFSLSFFVVNLVSARIYNPIDTTNFTGNPFTSAVDGGGFNLTNIGSFISEKLTAIQTSVTGNTLSVSRDLASGSTDSPVVNIVQDNVGDDQYALNVQQDGSASAIKILHQGNLTSSGAGLQVNISGTNNSNGSGIIVTDTGGYGTDTIGLTLTKNSATQIARLNNTLSSSLASNYFYRNLGSAETNAPLVFIEQDNAGDDQNAQTIQNDGTGNGLFINQNNSGYGIDIDGDANSASDLTGLRVNVANAGAGEAYSAIFQTGNVGIGTSTPSTLLDLFSTATTTMSVDSNSATQGSCLKLKDSDGGGYSYITILDGTMTTSQVSCE